MHHAAPIAAAALAAAISAPALAGALNGEEIGEDAVYRSTACASPAEPDYSRLATIEGYNEAVRQYRAFSDEMKLYVACVEEEAQTDLDHLHQAIVTGAGGRVNDAQRAIDRGKIMLDSYSDELVAGGR